MMYPWLDHSVPYDPNLMFARPDLARYDRAGPRKRVAIVGGGIAGLAAAYELRQLGHSSTVFEASDRWGGRIQTARFSDGSYAELGAMRIPEDHSGVIGYANTFGIGLRPFLAVNGSGWLKFRASERTRLRDFEEVLPQYPNLRLRNQVLPTDIVGDLMQGAIAGLEGSTVWWDLFEGDLADPKVARFEAMTLWQYGQGHDRRRRIPLLNTDEWEWAGRGTGLYWFENLSMLEHVVEAAALLAPRKFEINGGMELLVDAFVDRLQGSLRLSTRVHELSLTPEGVRVGWADQFGSWTGDFDYVIMAVPAPALLRIKCSPDIVPPTLRDALSGLRYECSGKTVVHCRRRYWELHDQIAGGGSFTDLPIQQCWYPSDNTRPATEQEESAWRTTTVALWTYQEGFRDVPVPASWLPDDVNVSNGPGAFVGAYVWGANAQRFAAAGDADRDTLVVRSLEEIHPGITGDILDLQHLSWDQQANPGGGAFALFRPGDLSRYQKTICRPRPERGPRVFFAGEHLGVLHAWIQSSVQTAWSAVTGVCAAP